MTSNKTIIEVNGVKLEVDLRTAKRIDQFKIGDRVKVLVKEYDNYRCYHGMIVGFEPFVQLPTIVIAYLKTDYSSVSIVFVSFNSATKDIEIVMALDDDSLAIDREGVVKQLDRAIAAKMAEAEELERKRDYFLQNFSKYWGSTTDGETF